MDMFSYHNGLLHVENVSVRDIKNMRTDTGPVFVFSKNKIVSNIKQYKDELDKQKFRSSINYSVKANANPSILKLMKENGCSLTLVSGLELKLALELDFPMDKIVFNGNGKQLWEIDLAIQSGVLLNIDSIFNLEQTIDSCKRLDKNARVLLRVNPNIEVDVHHYVSTGKSGSKFGIDEKEFHKVILMLQTDTSLELVGLHCHLGSTIDNIEVISQSTENLVKMLRHLQKGGFDQMKFINIGGGLGIPYRKHELETLAWQSIEDVFKDNFDSVFREYSYDQDFQLVVEQFKMNKISTQYFLDTVGDNFEGKHPHLKEKLKKCIRIGNVLPTPADLIRKIKNSIQDDIHLIIEPGRSLVGDAAVLLCNVLGCKQSGDKNFVVVNGAMTEVIRPSLYGAYHHIYLAEPTTTKERLVFDIVGPVCESGDFLGKNRLMSKPHAGCLLVVFDVGAYCGSMSMTYNMRGRPSEVMVDGGTVEVIRRADTYDDLMAPYRM